MGLMFIQFKGVDGESVEGAATRNDDGTWSVTHSSGETETMSQFEMPDHWREQLKRWGQFFEEYDPT